MTLDELYRRLEHEQGAERDGAPIRIMTPGGHRFEILSVNWNEEDGPGEWVIIGETL
jgi:hypothetical protein